MWWFRKTPKRLYLDYAAATPVRSEVLAAMEPYQAEQFANASAIHSEGRAARAAVEQARLDVARTLGIRPAEVVFTASGSEANNLAWFGYIEALRNGGLAYADMAIITTAIEHPSVSEVAMELSRRGVEIIYAPVTEGGVVDESALVSLLSPKVVLVSVAYVNSEIGTIQPVKRISRLLTKYNNQGQTNIKFHLDAAQAPLWLACQVPPLGVDLMTLDAGKMSGPKGVGVLVLRGQIELVGIILGGGQESGLRAGTENTAGVVGAAKALQLAQAEYEQCSKVVSTQRDALQKSLLEIEGVILNGVEGDDRVANNVNISIPGLDTEYAVVALDAAGIAASTKSACSGAGGGLSAVVLATTGDAARAAATIRFTLGPNTPVGTKEIKHVTNALIKQIQLMNRFDSTKK